MGLLVLIVLIKLGFSHLIGRLGRKRDIGYRTAFWLTFFFGPIVGYICVIVSKKLN